MQDTSLLWGQDLAVSATGDLGLAAGAELGHQRVLRRLLTNPGDYIWQPGYGAGLGQFVGQTVNVSMIRAVIRSQILLESTVAQTPEPVISVAGSTDGSVYVDVRYVDANTGSTQILSFSITG